MLNPFAHEYTPASTFLPESSIDQPPKKPSQPKKKDQQSKKKKEPNQESNGKADKNHVKTESSKALSEKKSETKKAETKKNESRKNDSKKTENKKTDTKPSTNKTQNSKEQESSKPTHNKNRRKSSHQTKSTTNTASTHTIAIPNQFKTESKFITIEAAIDPVYRSDLSSNSINKAQHINNQKNSIGDKHLFEHGYERYIDWIDRSLRMYDTVTIIGMDNAIIDIVSLVTILHDRKIGVHDEIETFSMDTGINNRITACLQVKLHPFY